MPPQSYHCMRVGSSYAVYCCATCAPAIIHALSNGVKMSDTLGGCNNYYAADSHKSRKEVIKLLHHDDAWYSYIERKWRFSNDGRRFLIQKIKEQIFDNVTK